MSSARDFGDVVASLNVSPAQIDSAKAHFATLRILGEVVSSNTSLHLLAAVAQELHPTIKVEPHCEEKLYWSLIGAHVDATGKVLFSDEIIAKHLVKLFYATCKPERFQLFNHLSAGELCFVDVDSLFLEAIHERNVDWHLLQTLHVVYKVETILKRFIVRGAKIHLIAFRCMEQFYEESPELRLARSVVIQRLESIASRSNHFQISQFDNWWDTSVPKNSYAAHHERLLPEFVVVNDGEQLDGRAPLEFQIAPTVDSTPALKRMSAGCAFALRHLMSTVISLKTHVVLSSRVLFKDNDAIAFVVRAPSSRFVGLTAMRDSLAAVAASQFPWVAPKEVEEDFVAEIDAKAQKHEIAVGPRESCTLAALGEVLSAHPELRPFVKLHTVFLATVSQLPLSSRSLPRPKSAAVEHYLNVFAHIATKYSSALPDVDEKYCDLIDGHLFGIIAHHVTKAQELSSILDENTIYTANCMWVIASNRAGLKKQPFEPFELTINDVVLGEAVSSVQPAAVLNHDLVKHIVGSSLPTVDPVLRGLKGSLLVMTEEFLDLDVPPGVKEEEEFDKQPEDLQRRMKKAGDGLTKAVSQTAESMNVKPFLSPHECLAAIESTQKEVEKKSWAKQASKKGRQRQGLSDKERIKIENTVRRATTGSVRTVQQLTTVLSSLQKTVKSLEDDLARLDKFVSEVKTSNVEGAAEDAVDSEDEADADEEKDRRVWKLIVGDANEQDFVLPIGRFDCTKALEHIDSVVKQQLKLASQKNSTAILEADDNDASLRLKGEFFRRLVHHLRFKALMEGLRLARKVWEEEISEARLNSVTPKLARMIPMFQRLQSVLNHIEATHISTGNAERREIREAAVLTGFGEEYEKLIDEADNTAQESKWRQDRAIDVSIRPNLGSDHTPARFQMRTMGHLLPRDEGKVADSRVPFKPDPWQIELLDIVDRNGSAIVCAPTSAGKTFISYYCMKKVLKQSDDEVVVYVCPTRALVNQALADIYGRYGKKSYPIANHHVWGCLGGADMVKHPFKCQVLVTLPETLESIFLSPKYQSWVKKIRYVIFDEIHSLENTGNGDIWERLLMLTKCPFVALSATLGATEPVLNWLNGVQAKIKAQSDNADRDFTVHLVPKLGTKINRWSDIQKYAYLPSATAEFRDLNHAEAHKEGLLAVHPMSAITLDMLRDKFPEDLPFVPSETLHVFDRMREEYRSMKDALSGCNKLSTAVKNRMKELTPEKYSLFDKSRFMTQTAARQYEADVKAELRLWGAISAGNFAGFESDGEDGLKQAKKAMTVGLKALLQDYENTVKAAELAASEVAKVSKSAAYPDTSSYVKQNMLSLLTTLKGRQLLPTIVFSFEESECHELLDYVVTQLEEAETKFRSSREFEKWAEERNRKAEEQRERRDRLARGSSKIKEKDEEKGEVTVRQDEAIGVDEDQDYSIPEVLPQFSFSGLNHVGQKELADIAGELKRSDDDLVYRAFQRGIGLHTPDVKGRFRIHVERLFRSRYLNVVFATEGLALGVHSPCRSVVLAGDHVHLNTSQFRQMSGRAGRRGLDFLGHVVFIGVSQSKIQRLFTSDMNTLKGHVHIDGVASLRLQQLHDSAAVDKPAAVQSIDRLLCEPLFKLGRESKDYARFQGLQFAATLALLGQFGLVRKDAPSSLGCLATRVLNTYREAKGGIGAIVFSVLLGRGFFHSLAGHWATEGSRAHVYEHVLQALCYLFTLDKDNSVLLDVHRSFLSDPTLYATEYPELAPTNFHDVILPGIKQIAVNELLRTELEAYNAEVLKTYSGLLAHVATNLEAETALPFAKQSTTSKRFSPCAKQLGESPLLKAIDSAKFSATVRSPFAAIAGSGDKFNSTADLRDNLHEGLFLDTAHLPTLDFLDEYSHRGDQILINAAVPDFIDEGSQYVNNAPRRLYLEEFNGLRQDKSWYTLNRFMTVVSNLSRGLKNDDKLPCMLDGDNTDMVFQVVQEIELQLERRAEEISFKFPSSKAFAEAQTQQAKKKKERRPALAREKRSLVQRVHFKR